MSAYAAQNTTVKGGASGNSTGGGGGGDHDEAEMLTKAIAVQVNIFVFGLLGLVVLLRFPLLITFLRSRYGRPILQVFGKGASSDSAKKRVVYDGNGRRKLRRMSSADTFESTSIRRGALQAQASAPVALNLPPRHVSHVPSVLHRAVNLLRLRVMPGYTLGQFLILMNYTYIMLYGTFMMSNPFTDGVRAGWLAVSQLPLVFALGQKSSILGSLLGCGYEALNYIHRYVGRVIVLASNIHSLYYIYKWTANGTFLAKMAIPKFFWGFVFLIAMDVMFFFSLEHIRRKTYQLFFWSHTIGTIALIPGGILHYPAIRPYMITCVVLYGVDRLIRAFKSSITTATLTNLPKMDMAYIEVPNIKSGWRAGQHVRLRVLSSGMGLFGWTESHPFTIASAGGSDDGLILLCKKAGDWTSKLVDLAKELDEQSAEGQGQGKVKVWIEGPFGGSRMVFTGFSAAVLVVGGSGITFGLSMMEEVLGRDRNSESRLRYLELVWLVQDPESVLPLIPLFQSLVKDTNFTVLRISIHYTRALKGKMALFEGYETVPCSAMALAHPNLTLSPGRPDIKSVLTGAIDTVLEHNKRVGSEDQLGLSGLAVGICGPQSLGDSIVRAISGVDGRRRTKVGGIEVHEETFSM